MKVNWSEFKTFFTTRGVSPQYLALQDMYWLKAFDGPFHLECMLYKSADPTGYAEFEATYKADANSNLVERDADGTDIFRPKSTTTGNHFQLHSVEFTTATIDGYYNKGINPITLEETDLGYVTCKLYDAGGTEILDQPTADTACVLSVYDWVVDYEIELRGAEYRHAAAPVVDVRFWASAAPGILNLPFTQGGINLKHVQANVKADGASAKFLHPSEPITGLNRFRLILKHPAGHKHNASLEFELYKP